MRSKTDRAVLAWAFMGGMAAVASGVAAPAGASEVAVRIGGATTDGQVIGAGGASAGQVSHTPGQSLHAEIGDLITQHEPPQDALHLSQVTAQAGPTATGNSHQIAAASLSDSLVQHLPGQSRSTTEAHALYEDTLTLTGTDLGRAVVLHARLDLDTLGNLQQLGFAPGASQPLTTVASQATLSISGTGIGPGPLDGNTLYGLGQIIADGNGNNTVSAIASPLTIDFTLSTILGQATPISIRLEELGETTLTSPLQLDDLSAAYLFRAALNWDPRSAFVTDLDGNLLAGIGAVSAGGFQYLDASPVTSAAPEPAAWAVMLLGFGAMGVQLRRRRRVRLSA